MDRVYILSILVAAVALALLWFPVLWLMNGSVRSETTYQEYVKRNILKQLHDTCSDGELIWVLHHLNKNELIGNLNRTQIRDKIIEIQSKEMSQWEFRSDNERIISPKISEICKQNYETFMDELEANCTVEELHKICNYINVEKCKESNFNSKWDWVEEIINVKRTRDLNVTKLIDKFCIEQKLQILTEELITSCTGARSKQIFKQLIHRKRNCDVICDDCVEKMEFIEAVIEVKRRCYHQVNVYPLLHEFCVQPELKILRQKLMDNCSGIHIKQILEEIDDKLTCDYCVEKADFVNEIIDAWQRRLTIKITTLIQQYCFQSLDD